MPPKIHTANTMPGEPTARIMSEGTRKMPLPITVPTTTAQAVQNPNERRNPILESVMWAPLFNVSFTNVSAINLVYKQRRENTGEERRAGADHHVPGEGDGRSEANIQ